MALKSPKIRKVSLKSKGDPRNHPKNGQNRGPKFQFYRENATVRSKNLGQKVEKWGPPEKFLKFPKKFKKCKIYTRFSMSNYVKLRIPGTTPRS